jgi:RimJ/RimL family protein N-acetyltransferase
MTDAPWPMRTQRLVLRFVRTEDIEPLTAYRNDPAVAALQDWELPYPRERAEQLVAAHEGLADLANGRGHQIGIEHEGRLVGDVYVGLHEQGGIADLGYSLIPEAQGRGLAHEAVSAIVDDLVDRLAVHRLVAELSPENHRSARLLERLGMTFEAHTKQSFWWRGQWDDNLCYAMTADERRAWRDRPRTPPAGIRLVEITEDNRQTYSRLRVHHSQRRFVASVQDSYVDALFPGRMHDRPLVAIMRGIEADGDPVGFLMWAQSGPRPYLWRLLIDRSHAGRGIGRHVMDLWIEAMAAQGHTEAETSWVQAPGGPEPFHLRSGFTPTGEYDDGEAVGILDLRPHQPTRPSHPA